MTDRVVHVTGWPALERAPEVTERDRHRVATIFTEQAWDWVVWLPEWLVDDKDDLEPVAGSEHLFVGELEDYSPDAWQLAQPHRNEGIHAPSEFLPKSSVVVFERETGVEAIETPQQGLGSFEGGEEA